jgi:hypothetical protein
MTTFFVILLIVFPIVAIIIWLRQKEGARRAESAAKEKEFLAAMRSNPTAAVGPTTPAVVPPLIVGAAPPQAQVLVQASPSIPASVPAAFAAPELPRPPSAPPKDGHCLVCGQQVDMRSNDASRWGVKIPEPGADRLIWVHFHCLAARLQEVRALREAIEQLVDSVDAEPTEPALSLRAPLARLRALAGR